MITIPTAKFRGMTKDDWTSLPTATISSLFRQYTQGAYRNLLAIDIDVRYYKGNKLDQAPLGGLDMWLAFKFAFSTTSGGATGSLQYAKEVQKGSYFFVYGIKKPLADKYYGNVTVTYKPANGPAETKNKTMTWK